METWPETEFDWTGCVHAGSEPHYRWVGPGRYAITLIVSRPGAVSSKNWLAGVNYDVNGNALAVNAFALTYDMENRLATATSGTAVESYYYDESKRRVEKTMGSNDYLYFYGPSGRLLSIRSVAANGVISVVADRLYFGGMLLGSAGASGNLDVSTLTDRLGTAATGYPYGTDKGGSVGNDQPDFATYTKDGTTGFEYAMHRYYSAGLGRFLTADPSLRNVSVGYPMTWNAFAYGNGDPLNQTDQSGLDSTICTYTPAAYEPFHCAVVPDGTNTPTPDGTSVVAITNTESVTVNGDQDYVDPYDASNSNPDTAPTGGPGSSGGQAGGNTNSNTAKRCAALAQEISNLKQTLRNKAWNLERNPGRLEIDDPGPLWKSQWGHVELYTQYQQNLANAINEWSQKCGGGDPPSVPPAVDIVAPSTFDIPSWLLYGAVAAGVVGCIAQPEVCLGAAVVGGAAAPVVP